MEKKLGLLKEFRDFAIKGNVVDLAVAVVIGGAFGKIVTSLVENIIMPILTILTGRINFNDLKWVITPESEGIKEVAFRYGAFFQSIIDFVIIAFCIFIAIKILNSFKRKQEAAPEAEAAVSPMLSKEEQLLTEIRDLLKTSKTN